MPFFSPAMKTDDAGSPITEDSDHGWAWTEAREAIGVPKTPRFSHPQSVPDFQATARALSPLRTAPFSSRFYPLRMEKTHFIHQRKELLGGPSISFDGSDASSNEGMLMIEEGCERNICREHCIAVLNRF